MAPAKRKAAAAPPAEELQKRKIIRPKKYDGGGGGEEEEEEDEERETEVGEDEMTAAEKRGDEAGGEVGDFHLSSDELAEVRRAEKAAEEKSPPSKFDITSTETITLGSERPSWSISKAYDGVAVGPKIIFDEGRCNMCVEDVLLQSMSDKNREHSVTRKLVIRKPYHCKKTGKTKEFTTDIHSRALDEFCEGVIGLNEMIKRNPKPTVEDFMARCNRQRKQQKAAAEAGRSKAKAGNLI